MRAQVRVEQSKVATKCEIVEREKIVEGLFQIEVVLQEEELNEGTHKLELVVGERVISSAALLKSL